MNFERNANIFADIAHFVALLFILSSLFHSQSNTKRQTDKIQDVAKGQSEGETGQGEVEGSTMEMLKTKGRTTTTITMGTWH